MSSIMELFKGLLGAKATFSKLESAILGAVESKLAPDIRELWVKQLEAVNKIHRSPDGEEVNLFVIRNGKAAFPQELRFSSDGEVEVAVVTLRAVHSAAKLRARVWCVEGHVFMIVYDTPARIFEQAAQGEWEVHCDIVNPLT